MAMEGQEFSHMIYCPDCGTANDEGARFCDSCGRSLEDVKAASSAANPSMRNDQKDSQGRILADDGKPVGDDIDDTPGGERLVWKGRPSKLWSPRMALTNRYRLTNQRMVMEFGFIGRRTEEIDLYRINDVSVKQNPFERIVGIGDIYVSSADSSTPHKFLHNIGDPVRVKDIIRELARIERHKRRVLLREDVGIDEF